MEENGYSGWFYVALLSGIVGVVGLIVVAIGY